MICVFFWMRVVEEYYRSDFSLVCFQIRMPDTLYLFSVFIFIVLRSVHGLCLISAFNFLIYNI